MISGSLHGPPLVESPSVSFLKRASRGHLVIDGRPIHKKPLCRIRKRIIDTQRMGQSALPFRSGPCTSSPFCPVSLRLLTFGKPSRPASLHSLMQLLRTLLHEILFDSLFWCRFTSVESYNSTVNNGFKLSEVSADKAYSSRKNLEIVNNFGGTACVPFKSNSTRDSRGSYL